MIDVIANRYAEALFQLSEEENITKEIYNELHDVVEVIKNNKELDNVLKSPLVAKNEKTQLIEALFNNKINNDLKNFLKILVEKGRISSLKSIELTFKELLNDKKYSEALDSFASLRPSIDAMFDSVMVMDKDEAIKNNRLGLLKQIYDTMLSICDLSKIVYK